MTTKRSSIRFGEPIDDGRHGPYKHHFACFQCRKVFKPHTLKGQSPDWETVRCCPDCGGQLWDCGAYFKAPKRRNESAWAALEKRVTAAPPRYKWGDPRRRGLKLLRKFERRR